MNRHALLLARLLPLTAALALVACGGGAGANTDDRGAGSSAVGDVQLGQVEFREVCSLCHGLNGEGRRVLGSDLRHNMFVQGKSDDELAAFIVAGRSASDPANQTGVDMPPRGGNPELSDDKIGHIVAYLRSLQ
jgi:disulfide bond formation protein DsbB